MDKKRYHYEEARKEGDRINEQEIWIVFDMMWALDVLGFTDPE